MPLASRGADPSSTPSSGGEHSATIASLIETCKLNGVNPCAYLADVITRIVAGHPQDPRSRPELIS